MFDVGRIFLTQCRGIFIPALSFLTREFLDCWIEELILTEQIAPCGMEHNSVYVVG